MCSHTAEPVSGCDVDRAMDPPARMNSQTASADIVTRVIGAATAMYLRITCMP